MDEASAKTFEAMDERDLALVLTQVNRRMLMLRAGVPDTVFWYSVLARICKLLSASPTLTTSEKNLLSNPPKDVNARIQVIKRLRERSGARLYACRDIVDEWMKLNL